MYTEEKGTYRFVITVDVYGRSLADAYDTLYTKMSATGEDWASTDEVYGTDGDDVAVADIERVRMEAYAERELKKENG